MENTQTKQCPQCLAEIPKRAAKCSHCSSKQPNRSLLVFAIIFGGFMMWFVFTSGTPTPSPSNTYTPPAKVSTFELGTYKVESEEFEFITPKEVNLWQSYSNRTKVGVVEENDIVEVTNHDSANDYCKVTADGQAGWMACGWLVKQ